MKFVHLGDLHLGKIIYNVSLLDIQKDLLNQVVDYMVEENINTCVIAGDVYDRSVPSKESVEVLNDFLDTMINKHHKTVLMISGNHDGAQRLSFASSLLKKQGLHIVTYPELELKPIEVEGVNFYMIPFFKPSYIRYLYENEDLKTYQDAFKYYLEQQNIDHSKPCVCVTHQFIAGNKDVVRSESEVILSVGGTEIIDVDLFKDFNYVALGHLHASQKIKYDYVRYSGSLMKYSFDEVNQTKGLVEVEINDETTVKTVPLKPLRDLIKVKGTFEEIMKHPVNDKDYVAVELLDKYIIGHASSRLKDIYPNLLQLNYPQLAGIKSNSKTSASLHVDQSPYEVFQDFYEKMIGEKMNDDLKEIVNNLLKEGDEDATKVS